MKKLNLCLGLLALSVCFTSCKNRDINEGEQFKPREIHEDIVFHFDTILVDGIEYLILEKDNNNPHEGFGFMAFRANKLMEKQDTVLAYLKTLTDLQIKVLSELTEQPIDELTRQTQEILNTYLEEQRSDLINLERNEFQNSLDSASLPTKM
ncbi:unnamed protein product [Chrysoparadoxa australica]